MIIGVRALPQPTGLQKQDIVQCILHDKAPKCMCQQRRKKSGALSVAGQKESPESCRTQGCEQRIAVTTS